MRCECAGQLVYVLHALRLLNHHSRVVAVVVLCFCPVMTNPIRYRNWPVTRRSKFLSFATGPISVADPATQLIRQWVRTTHHLASTHTRREWAGTRPTAIEHIHKAEFGSEMQEVNVSCLTDKSTPILTITTIDDTLYHSVTMWWACVTVRLKASALVAILVWSVLVLTHKI